jgi:hypothetical protein
MRIARNIAIVAALAATVAFVPQGGDAAQGVLAAVLLAFMGAIGYAIAMLYRRSWMTLGAMTDQRRALLYSAGGLIALLVVAFFH